MSTMQKVLVVAATMLALFIAPFIAVYFHIILILLLHLIAIGAGVSIFVLLAYLLTKDDLI